MSMNAEKIIALMKGELKQTEELLETLEGKEEFAKLKLQTEGKLITLKQLLEVIEDKDLSVDELVAGATKRSEKTGNGKEEVLEYVKE